jgi:hypothetical protein
LGGAGLPTPTHGRGPEGLLADGLPFPTAKNKNTQTEWRFRRRAVPVLFSNGASAAGHPFDLPYSVELWVDSDSHVEELIALPGDYRVARAAYQEAVKRRPGRIVTLRQKTRLLADSRAERIRGSAKADSEGTPDLNRGLNLRITGRVGAKMGQWLSNSAQWEIYLIAAPSIMLGAILLLGGIILLLESPQRGRS